MDPGRHSRSHVAPVVAVVVVLLLLPALYVLAIGPVGALINNGNIHSESTLDQALQVIYMPLGICAEHCPPLEWLLVRNTELCGG